MAWSSSMPRCPSCGDRLEVTVLMGEDKQILSIDQSLCARAVCRSQVPRELCRVAEPQWLAKQWALMQEVLQWPRKPRN